MKNEVLVLFAASCVLLSLCLPVVGQVSFFQPPTYSGNWDVFVADFNGDGKQDLITKDGTLNLGKGDGTFVPGTNVLGTTGMIVAAVADFNGDGKPDVLESGTGLSLVMQVLLGKGDGTFQTSATTTGSEYAYGFVAADVNGDGEADVVLLSNTISNSTLFIYLGNGDGTFKPPVSYNLGSTVGWVVSLTDFNGDNRIDIAVSVTGQEMVFLGNGDGTFQSPLVSAGASSTSDATAGDFDGDGKLDLALDGVILLGNGDGTFQAPLSSTGAFAAAGDFNGDGKLDLTGDGQIYLGAGDGTFSTSHAYLMESYSNAVVADFNGDGKLDIATGNMVLLGNGDGTFRGNPSSVGQLSIVVEFHGEVVGDFDHNGTQDVAVCGLTNVYILGNDGSGALSLTHTYPLPTTTMCGRIVTSDLNGDGNLDLVIVGGVVDTIYPEMYDWNYSVLLGNGDGTFQSPIFYQQSLGADSPEYYSVTVADFDNDGKTDIVINLPSVSLWALLLGVGDGTFAGPTYLGAAAFPPLMSADFNGDGNVDIAGQDGGTALVFGNGDGTFQPPVFPTNLQSFYPQLTADLNDDGKPDLISGSQVALGNGDVTFTLLPSFSQNVTAISDLSGDGRPDAVYQAYNDNMSQTGVMLGNGDGTFGAPTNVFNTTNNQYQEVVVADMNGDGRPDLLFFAVGGGAVGVLLNTTPPGFEVSASALSPATVIAGSSATSTVNVIPTFGFNKAVTLSCAGLPAGVSCSFVPPSFTNSSGNSALTIATSSNTAAGTYSIQIQGTAGSVTNSAAVSLVVQAPPDFSFGPETGSTTSQTVAAGQAASFSLALSPSSSFAGTVNLTCAITPSVSRGPTCSLPSSVQIGGSGAQSVSVSVGTTAPMTTSALPHLGFPSDDRRLLWALLLLATASLCNLSPKRISDLAKAIVVVSVVGLASCGGNNGNSSSSHTTPGTPAGTYETTITATSGNLSHSTTLTLVVK